MKEEVLHSGVSCVCYGAGETKWIIVTSVTHSSSAMGRSLPEKFSQEKNPSVTRRKKVSERLFYSPCSWFSQVPLTLLPVRHNAITHCTAIVFFAECSVVAFCGPDWLLELKGRNLFSSLFISQDQSHSAPTNQNFTPVPECSFPYWNMLNVFQDTTSVAKEHALTPIHPSICLNPKHTSSLLYTLSKFLVHHMPFLNGYHLLLHAKYLLPC